jgi:hypothetical protein
MREFSEVTLKVTVEKPHVGETRQLLVQAVDTIHESNYVFEMYQRLQMRTKGLKLRRSRKSGSM